MVSVPYEITLLSNSIVSMFVAFLVSVPYEITLLSNIIVSDYVYTAVSVPYEITLLSNPSAPTGTPSLVSVPYEITLLSNLCCFFYKVVWFQYLMKLHYSQTGVVKRLLLLMFQYLMKLHYSQTSNKLRHYNAQGNNIRYIYYTI